MRLARSLGITGAAAAKHAQHVLVTGSLDNGLNLVTDPFEIPTTPWDWTKKFGGLRQVQSARASSEFMMQF